MANPTAQVPMGFGSYDRDNDSHYWPLDPTNTSDTFYTGELIGFKPTTGYATHLDDTGVFLYLGNKTMDTHRLQTDTPAFDFKEMARWTRFIDMPVDSGTPALPTNFGDPAYANDSGHVKLSSTTNNNLIGMVVDVCRWASTGGVGSGGVVSLSGNGNPQAVRVACIQPGALMGLLVQGIPGPGTAGGASGAAKAMKIVGGKGADNTAANATAAGAGGGLTITGGAGGNATAGTGNGGAGGSITLNPGAGGTTTGGSAGAAGIVQLENNVAIPAGGSAAAQVQLSSTAGFGLYYGSGAPTVSAAKGSLYLRSDGASTSTRLYVNTDGGTTWTSFTSAA